MNEGARRYTYGSDRDRFDDGVADVKDEEGDPINRAERARHVRRERDGTKKRAEALT